MDKLLTILKENALQSADDIAVSLGCSVDEVRERIAAYEEEGVIRGYQAVVDEDKLDLDYETAVIEVRVVPEREGGFDRIASRISRFPEVESLYLMSGTYDLLIFLKGKNVRDVGEFVSRKLATLNGVAGTATHFKLKTYKQYGVMMEKPHEDERLKVSP